MKEHSKPIPQPMPWTKRFWEGCKKGELLIQKCKHCNKFIMYPKLFCPNCLSNDLEWVRSKGTGKVYSYSVVYSYAPTEFADDVPYIVAVIELDEGVHMMSNIIESKPEDVRCDLPVEVVFKETNQDFVLPKFKIIR